MRKILTTLMLFSVIIAFSKTTTVNDTIAISQNEVRWIEQPYTKTNGESSIHYYGVWKGYLLNTSKSVAERIHLAEKFNAKLNVIIIGRKKNGVFQPKRIAIY